MRSVGLKSMIRDSLQNRNLRGLWGSGLAARNSVKPDGVKESLQKKKKADATGNCQTWNVKHRTEVRTQERVLSSKKVVTRQGIGEGEKFHNIET